MTEWIVLQLEKQAQSGHPGPRQVSLGFLKLNPVIQGDKLRHRRLAWTLPLLLAFAVSFWGLSYKLSLYHPVAHQHPAAKLLSQKERPLAAIQLLPLLNRGRLVASASPRNSSHAFAALLSSAVLNAESCLRRESGPQDPHFPLTRSLRTIAPRPPPIAA